MFATISLGITKRTSNLISALCNYVCSLSRTNPARFSARKGQGHVYVFLKSQVTGSCQASPVVFFIFRRLKTINTSGSSEPSPYELLLIFSFFYLYAFG